MTGIQGTALITGIGAATAYKFAESGITVLSLLDIDLEKLEKTREELLLRNRENETKIHAIQVLTLCVDVTDETALTNAVQETVRRFGRIDVAVHAAGVGDVELATHEVPVDDWRRIIEIDQIGTWLCQRAVIRQMLKQELDCHRDGFTVSFLRSCKAWMPNFTPRRKSASMQFAQVREPGMIRDIQSLPIGRIGEPEEIADAILFLASPMSSFVYEIGLLVNGG
ncbi:hypothetical protein UA08_01431 [Talaromyces atroroseus]|uniref:Uncharacterized protein n=1 Tax=Talaromyces atroroseus TaxID=1441469 RepID=A0A1Q5QBD5_TALAT|nr:hypothetical protein UA08_01431 [Talaromyces atroroseus]OKL63226.1 hypothetical protein UA08_01431 [Talaromyces atroroseus]